MTLEQKLIDLFDLDTCRDVIRLKDRLEGHSLDDDGAFLIGNRAGPDVDISNYLHEMSHFIELSIPRLLDRPNGGWGLKIGSFTQVLFGREFTEPVTDQGVRREGRVWAIQANIMEALLMEVDVADIVSSARYIGCWVFWSQRFAFDDDEATHYFADYVDSKRNRYPIDKILTRFKDRVKALRETLDTSALTHSMELKEEAMT